MGMPAYRFMIEPVRRTAMVCRVIGTGINGMDTQEKTVVIAMKRVV